MLNKTPKLFRHHFEEATEVNKIRKNFYSRRTSGKSEKVSNLMIYFEKCLYPVALYIDFKAYKFNKKGIPIVKNDFVSLKNISPVYISSQYTKVLSFKQYLYLFKKFYFLRKNLRKYLKSFDLFNVCKLIADSILVIDDFEKKQNIHLSLLKHILESVGFAAQNTIKYSETNDLKLKKFAVQFIKIQMLGTILSPLIDREANKIQALGYGIITNDIPKIPFEYEKFIQ